MAGIDRLADVMGIDNDLDAVERDNLCDLAAAEIKTLRAALRDLIAMIDPIYDLEPVDRDAFYKAKAALERR